MLQVKKRTIKHIKYLNKKKKLLINNYLPRIYNLFNSQVSSLVEFSNLDLYRYYFKFFIAYNKNL